jgi:hypothetical protein
LQKEPQCLIGNAVLRIVKVNADSLSCQALTALWIVREELPKMKLPDFRVMGFEGLPGREFGELRDTCCHAHVLVERLVEFLDSFLIKYVSATRLSTHFLAL